MSGLGRGAFISIEGGEGVGKSLFQANLAQALQIPLHGRGVELITTREPGGTPAADQIRRLFGAPPPDDPLLMETEALLVSAARAQHVGRLIRPHLEKGNWILCDRFADSMRVYQGILGGLPETMLEQLIGLSTGQLGPDLTFILDCDVRVSLARLKGRGQAEPNEEAIARYDAVRASAHEKLRRGFLTLIERFPRRMVRLDASLPPEQLIKHAMHEITERLLDQP